MFGALLLFEDEFIHVVAISYTALILTELTMVALTIRTWHPLMVLAELLSILLYLLSLILLREFFGEFIPMSSKILHPVADQNIPFRCGVHKVCGLCVEDSSDHRGLLPAPLLHQIPQKTLLPSLLSEAPVRYAPVKSYSEICSPTSPNKFYIEMLFSTPLHRKLQ